MSTANMLKLSAFADEIGPDLDLQIRTCVENAVTHFELRGVYGKNVMDFDDALRAEIKTKLAASTCPLFRCTNFSSRYQADGGQAVTGS